MSGRKIIDKKRDTQKFEKKRDTPKRDTQQIDKEFNNLEKKIEELFEKEIDDSTLQSQFKKNFLPSGYMDTDLSIQIRRLRLHVIFLKLIAELDTTSEEGKRKLEKINEICSMIETDNPEWSGIHKSPYIQVENEGIYIPIAPQNIYEAKILFNKAYGLTKAINYKYKFETNIFNKNNTEVIIDGNEGEKFTYFISYTHLLALINKIKKTIQESGTGGKIRIIKVIKKY